MAIHKEVFRQVGKNAAQIDASHDWATADRVRMSDANIETHGGCNVLRLVNSNAFDVTISWTFDVGRSDSEIIKANSIRNINPEDGRNFTGFDLYSASANNLAADTIKYKMSKVLQIAEGK